MTKKKREEEKVPYLIEKQFLLAKVSLTDPLPTKIFKEHDVLSPSP